MTSQNNQRATKGNGTAKADAAKREARDASNSKANELTLRAWKKTYENRNKASKAGVLR